MSGRDGAGGGERESVDERTGRASGYRIGRLQRRRGEFECVVFTCVPDEIVDAGRQFENRHRTLSHTRDSAWRPPVNFYAI